MAKRLRLGDLPESIKIKVGDAEKQVFRILKIDSITEEWYVEWTIFDNDRPIVLKKIGPNKDLTIIAQECNNFIKELK